MTEKMGVCEGLAKTDEGKITEMSAFRFDWYVVLKDTFNSPPKNESVANDEPFPPGST